MQLALAPIKLKLLLLIVGLVAGLLVALPLVYYFLLRNDGTHYSTVGELRAVLNQNPPDPKASGNAAGSTVNLRSLIEAHPNDELIYVLRPNLDLTFQRVPVKTNSFGMRNRETTLAKPEGSFRVALLGDSFAFGWGVEEDKIFARVLEQRLAEAMGKPVEVLNFGVPGYSTFQEYAQYVEIGAKFSPDAVLVYFVENDWGLPYFLARSEPDSPLMTATDFARAVWNRKTEEAAKERDFYYGIMNPNDALRKLATFTEERGTKLFVAINPGKKYASDFKRLHVLRKNLNLQHLPLLEPTLKTIQERQIPPEALSLARDPHPSALKHEILGTLLAQGIYQALDQ
jgi:hypothetical protein